MVKLAWGGCDERIDVTHLSVFHSVSKRESARETDLPRLGMLSTQFFLSRARDGTTFMLHDLNDFYVERVTAHCIKRFKVLVYLSHTQSYRV